MAGAVAPLTQLGSTVVQAESLKHTQKFMKEMFAGPEVPEPAKPEAVVEMGDEGIRRGELAKKKRKRAMGEAYLTRGQERDVGAKLGGMAKTLG